MDAVLTILRAAGELTRLRILALLRRGALAVNEIVDVLGQSQPRVSRHLKLLCDAGLLDRFREGTLIFYRLSDTGLGQQLRDSILSFMDEADPQILADRDALKAIRHARVARSQAYFRANAEKWDEIRSLYVPEAEVEAALLDLAGGRAIGHLLDVGTGTGRMLQLFADRSHTGLGIDLSREMLAVARGELSRLSLDHCQVRQADMYGLPVDDGSQDLVVFHQVLHFAEHPEDALREAARVLAPAGRLLIADFAPHDEEMLREQHAHRRLGFDTDEVIRWAAEAGLKSRAVRHLDGGRLRVTLWRFDKAGMPDMRGADSKVGEAA